MLFFSFFFYIPVAVPIPKREEPASFIIARTSAKSTLTRPGTCRRKFPTIKRGITEQGRAFLNMVDKEKEWKTEA